MCARGGLFHEGCAPHGDSGPRSRPSRRPSPALPAGRGHCRRGQASQPRAPRVRTRSGAAPGERSDLGSGVSKQRRLLGPPGGPSGQWPPMSVQARERSPAASPGLAPALPLAHREGTARAPVSPAQALRSRPRARLPRPPPPDDPGKAPRTQAGPRRPPPSEPRVRRRRARTRFAALPRRPGSQPRPLRRCWPPRPQAAASATRSATEPGPPAQAQCSPRAAVPDPSSAGPRASYPHGTCRGVAIPGDPSQKNHLQACNPFFFPCGTQRWSLQYLAVPQGLPVRCRLPAHEFSM